MKNKMCSTKFVTLILALAAGMLQSHAARADINDCTMTISPAIVEYGTLQVDQVMARVTRAYLGVRIIPLTITCPEPEVMALEITGEHHHLNENYFALTTEPGGGEDSGHFGSVTFDTIILDGDLAVVWKEGRTRREAGGTVDIYNGNRVLVLGEDSPKGKTLTLNIRVNPEVSRRYMNVNGQKQVYSFINIELIEHQPVQK